MNSDHPRPGLPWAGPLMAGGLALVIWAVYVPGLAAPFIMDDASSITANRSIRSL